MRSSDEHPLLQMRGIRKSFSGNEVLHGVDFDLQPGEVHALVGENGAGKSTLIKILAGAHQDYQGSIRLRGQTVRFRRPRDAERHGVAVIYQELALVPYLSVAQNVLLGREPINRLGWLRGRALRRAASQVLRERLDVELDVSARVADLALASQQMVEIAKALSRQAKILVMDEPTSALSEADTVRLFTTIRQLRSQGVGIVYISHKLDEIYALADRITVLRDGQAMGTAGPIEWPPEELIQRMVGRRVAQRFPVRHVTPGAERLRVTGLCVRSPDRSRWLVADANLSVRAGEIVGLAGLLGSGASELLAAIYGRYGAATRGVVHVNGRPFARLAPRTALRRGLALLTNDRKASGLILPMSVLQNISLPALSRCVRGGLLQRRAERDLGAPWIDRLRIRAPSLTAAVTALSGGNQQKVLFARWLLTQPQVLLLDEPTRGVDVAAKADIYALLNELTARGLGIVLTTSELPELLALADRILVLHRGRIVTQLERAQATPERVLLAAMGAAPRTR